MITVDFDTPEVIQNIGKIYVANDSAHTLEFELVRGGAAIDLSGIDAKIRFATSDGFVGDEPMTVSDAQNGICTYKMKGAELVCGETVGIISLYNSESERESSSKFMFHVLPDLSSNESVRDSKQYSELEKAITRAISATTEVEELLSNLSDNPPVTHEELSSQTGAVLDEAITYDNRLAESFDEKIRAFATKDEAQEMCDLTYNAATAYADSGDEALKKQISAGAIKTISLADADTFYSGMAIVYESIDDMPEPSGHTATGVRYENTHILICSCDYDLLDQYGEGNYIRDSLDRYTQTLYKSGGEILVRTRNMAQSDGWSEWQNVSASVTYVDGKIGEIDSALDGILAIQAKLIGGESE